MSGVASALRAAWPQALARLTGRARDLATAEDALQDAVLRALESWPRTGIPDAPAAWLVTAAKNRLVDAGRRQKVATKHEPALERLAVASAWSVRALERPETLGWGDDLLRLVFTCCDPVLGLEERTALTLATVGGLTRDEIAAAFLVQPRTMEQRLTRARRRLAERKPSYEVPDVSVAPERVDAVLAVVHLIFNEGYWSGGDSPIREDLCVLALGLGRSLCALLPGVPEVMGLSALMQLHHARIAARADAEGNPVPLPDQDRSRWDRAAIASATTLLRTALSQGRPGAYQVEAAIAAVHCEAERAEATEWGEIARLYELLEAFRPSPVVRVNRAFAVGRAVGPRAGLALLEARIDEPALAAYPFALLVRGALREDAGDRSMALADYRAALELARNDAERAAIRRRMQGLDEA